MLEMVLRSHQTVKLDPPYLLRKYGATEEEFDQITNEDIKAELLDGELIVHSAASLRHDNLCTFLSFLVRGYADRRQPGMLYGANNAVMRLASHRKLDDRDNDSPALTLAKVGGDGVHSMHRGSRALERRK